MKLLLVDNVHMYKTPDGVYYTPSIYGDSFFQRYLNIFSEVRFVAKTKYVDHIDSNRYIRISSPNVEIYELTWYRGLKEFFKKSPQLIKQAMSAKEGCACVIYRVAQFESFLVYFFSMCKKPFALEVVNDPQGWTFTNIFIRKISEWMLKYMCQQANGTSYVTERYLQRKYPVNNKKQIFTSHYSSVELNSSYIGGSKHWENNRCFRLLHVANVIDGVGKGNDTVLFCLKELISRGANVDVTFVGDGPSVEAFKKMACELGINDRVFFKGRINDKNSYMEFIREHDALIFPSHSEGLPRSVIEAMACGLPCVASPVGGIPELLDNWGLIAYDNYIGYADAIQKLIDDCELYHAASVRNINKAKEFEHSVLTLRRNEFYSNLKQICLCHKKSKN